MTVTATIVALDKRLATAQARAALIGVQLLSTSNDREQQVFVAVQGAWCQELTNLDAVEALLDRVQGSAA